MLKLRKFLINVDFVISKMENEEKSQKESDEEKEDIFKQLDFLGGVIEDDIAQKREIKIRVNERYHRIISLSAAAAGLSVSAFAILGFASLIKKAGIKVEEMGEIIQLIREQGNIRKSKLITKSANHSRFIFHSLMRNTNSFLKRLYFVYHNKDITLDEAYALALQQVKKLGKLVNTETNEDSKAVFINMYERYCDRVKTKEDFLNSFNIYDIGEEEKNASKPV